MKLSKGMVKALNSREDSKGDFEAELERLRVENEELRRELMKDDLTGLYNARCLRERLESCIAERSGRNEQPALLFIDVDHFKAVNEKHGHMAAGSVLRGIGELIAQIVRKNDIGFRYGGDEFVVLVSGGPDGARRVGERIRSIIENTQFVVTGMQGRARVNVTVSLGMRVIGQNDQVHEILEAADRAMFEAKRNSRNTLVAA